MKKLFILLLGVIGALVIFSGCAPCEHNCDTYSYIKQEAICGVVGIKEWRCEDCDKVMETEAIPATGDHDWAISEAVEPTCTSEGWEEGLQCTICKDRRATKIEKLPHAIKIIEGNEAGCETSGMTDGEFCMVCEQLFAEQEYIEPLGHTCDVYLEIDTFNEFMDYDQTRNAIIYLEYCMQELDAGLFYYMEIPAECTYMRVVGDSSKTYKLIFVLLQRTEPFRLDLVNANLLVNQRTMFTSESEADIHIGFYGESASLVSGKAADGAKGSLGSMDGENGANGERGISVGGDLTITVGANTCRVKGGDGGNGGKGNDGLAMDGFDGGNGGNGGAGIAASSITVIAEDGYSTSNLSIAGGKGGTGGVGGNGSWLYDDGRNGSNGSSASATTVKVIYK